MILRDEREGVSHSLMSAVPADSVAAHVKYLSTVVHACNSSIPVLEVIRLEKLCFTLDIHRDTHK